MQRSRVALHVVAEPKEEGADLEQIFRQYSPYVAAIALRLLGRDEEVDDAVQDVFLIAIRGLSQLRDPQAIRGWLATVTVRVARRRLRLRRFKQFLGIAEPVDYESIASSTASADQQLVLKRVYLALDRLPVDQRLAWTLRYIEGEQLEDVAQLCSCSLATAKRKIAAAQLELEGALADE